MSSYKFIDPMEFSGIRWWLKKRRRYYFQNILTIALFFGFFGPLFLQVPADTMTMTDWMLIAPLALMMAFFGGYQLWQWLRTYRLKIQDCKMGTVKDMYRVVKRRKKSRSYRIVVDVNGKEVEAISQLRTYHKAEKGDKMLLFTIGGDTVFCVHPDM